MISLGGPACPTSSDTRESPASMIPYCLLGDATTTSTTICHRRGYPINASRVNVRKGGVESGKETLILSYSASLCEARRV